MLPVLVLAFPGLGCLAPAEDLGSAESGEHDAALSFVEPGLVPVGYGIDAAVTRDDILYLQLHGAHAQDLDRIDIWQEQLDRALDQPGVIIDLRGGSKPGQSLGAPVECEDYDSPGSSSQVGVDPDPWHSYHRKVAVIADEEQDLESICECFSFATGPRTDESQADVEHFSSADDVDAVAAAKAWLLAR